MGSRVFLFPTLENLKLVTGQRLRDWPKHYPALEGEITESIPDGAAHEKDHMVLSRASTVTRHSFRRCQGSKLFQEYFPSQTKCWRRLIC